jgi:hypothetical protein
MKKCALATAVAILSVMSAEIVSAQTVRRRHDPEVKQPYPYIAPLPPELKKLDSSQRLRVLPPRYDSPKRRELCRRFPILCE